ncbi:MAG TPA: ABC transporter ATP-binding protein [Chthonomonadaceae bacterium]|nr:ABC transporter ATP-binding protein [Chthonomonadaceae bacterium]
MPVATLTGLTVRYGRKTAVNDLTVEVPEGCTGLLGPNGAGKSTLIKTILGFMKPALGGGAVLGMDIATQGSAIRQRVGLMPEIDCHIPGMNAVTFVAFAGELAGMPSSQAMRRAHETLDYCGLGEARYRKVETYSTGMKQRIKLAQALVHGPKLLLLDEPTNGLDPQGRDDMLELIRSVSHGKGIDVVVSSHLLPDIERTCDSVIVMRQGQLATQGSIAALRSTAGTQLEVETRYPSAAFVAALERRGIAIADQEGARYRVRIPDGCADPGRQIMEAALESATQLRGFKPAIRSLEDVFLAAVD